MDKPIRIAQVVGKIVQGGVDTVVMNYYRNIDRNLVQFDFFSDGLEPTFHDDEILKLGGKIYRLPPYDKGMLANLRVFREILKENNYQIIHSHMSTLSPFWLREAKKAGIPIRIAHSHTTASIAEGKRVLAKYMLRPFSRVYPTHLITCSQYSGEWLFGKKSPMYIMRNAINIEKFRFNQDIRNKVHSDLGIEGKFVVGHVGRFVNQKNHHFLINSFYQALAQDPNLLLLLIGDGELRKDVETQIHNLGISGSVILLGNRDDMSNLYQAMDVFVLPSIFEGLSVACVEAQNSGLPCILSTSVSTETALSDHVKFIPLKEEMWVNAILSAKANNKRIDPPVVNEFDIQNSAPKLCDYYLSLL